MPEKSAAMPAAAIDRGHSVRSYVLRGGRVTAAQARAWRQLAPRYVVAAEERALDWAGVFGRRAPLIAEIGSGDGAATAQTAAANPAGDYVVFEVYAAGCGALMNRLAAAQADNARIVCADAAAFLPLMFADGALAGVNVFFPDPWPKARHRKRRLLRRDFIGALAQKIACGGALHVATDAPDYAADIAAAAADTGAFARETPPPPRPPSAFARRAAAAGRAVADLCFRRR